MEVGSLGVHILFKDDRVTQVTSHLYRFSSDGQIYLATAVTQVGMDEKAQHSD